MHLKDRKQAGTLLGKRLLELPLQQPLVLALPRGGVPVAAEVAKALSAPLDVLIVRKVGAPGHEEFGIGAVTEDGHYWVDPVFLERLGAHAVDVERTLARERNEVKRRVRLYRNDTSLPDVRGRSVVVVDDGLATGVTARVACAYLKKKGAAEVILAVPVCSSRTAALVRREVDQLVCLDEPENFYAVGQFYDDFSQLEDKEVLHLLRAREEMAVPQREVSIANEAWKLEGNLAVPKNAKGVVIFAHGSGSSRFSPRNRQIARAFHREAIATLLFDLLTREESSDRQNIFDIPLLGRRLLAAVRWLRTQEGCENLPLGFFGASTGAGAALWVAAELGDEVSAVVSRGGRPDLALGRLDKVTAPTLLLVGGLDIPVIEMNQQAQHKLQHSSLEIIPGATHLFEEPGTMAQVEEEAKKWFLSHFPKGGGRAAA